MRRYELTRLEAAKAYSTLLASLDRLTNIELEWKHLTQAERQADGAWERHNRQSDDAFDALNLAKAGLDPYLDSGWRYWLDNRLDDYVSQMPQLSAERPIIHGLVYDEIRRGLTMRLFDMDPAADPPPTPPPRTTTLPRKQAR